MTISQQTRLNAMGRALEYMLEQIGDEPTSTFHIGVTDAPVADLPNTTWVELAEAGLVQRRRVIGGPCAQYEFTPHGWLAAHDVTGALQSDKVRQRGQILAAALKGYVKGRAQHDKAMVDLRTLAGETGIPDGWLLNALKSGLLQKLIPDKKMNAFWETTSRSVRIPSTFGQPHLSVDDKIVG